jgi:hypothetical protein
VFDYSDQSVRLRFLALLLTANRSMIVVRNRELRSSEQDSNTGEGRMPEPGHKSEMPLIYGSLPRRMPQCGRVEEKASMGLMRFFAWCRAQLFGPPRKQQPQEQTVLAWHVPPSLLRDERRR